MAKEILITQFKHFAVFQTAFLGDTALALYLAEEIKILHPEAKITFIATPGAAPLLKCAAAVKNVIAYDKRVRHKGLSGMKFIAAMLRDIHVDCIIAPHRSARTAIAVFLAKPKFSVGFDINSFSFLYKRRVKYPYHLHEVDRNRALIGAFSRLDYIWHSPPPQPKLLFAEEDIKLVDKLISDNDISADNHLIALAPGSVWPTKRWPAKHFRRLVQDFASDGTKCVLIGSEKEFDMCKEIAGDGSAVNLAGRLTLPQSLLLIKKCKVIVTNDSAPTHLAALAECPSITIFGPTAPLFGFGPASKNSKVFGINDLKCRPCEIHGSMKCPLGTHECMEKIRPDEVYLACMEVIHSV